VDDVTTAPPPEGVAIKLKLDGSAPQFRHETVPVISWPFTTIEERVAVGLNVLKLSVTSALVLPLNVTVALAV
jgi:hypothetical protein